MINRQELLSDLQDLLKRLEADLLDRSDSTEVPEVGQSLQTEYDKAKQAERTAQNYEDWRSDYITQVAAAWVLSSVFVRFLEDNRLIDPPKIAGPSDRLQRARDEHEIYFRKSPTETDREYLLAVFDELAKLPGTRDIFGEHNPIRDLPWWLSGDAAGELLRFFRKIDADSGVLIHDFSDPEWDTRFLGDLYQDLSETARKKYALLQTPEFVEEFILDRTLDPALDEFGLVVSGQLSVVSGEDTTDNLPWTTDCFKMIDPACGSGHFLLGAFPRILERWQKQEPGTNGRELVQRALDSIHGVDVNPYAVAIARFRLLLAALKACGITRISESPAFQMNLACGDSLYHGVERQQLLGDWTDESHYFRTEDAENLRRILAVAGFHCVVANPPYITPKDRAANQAYRKLYPKTCHMKYSLAVPFMERIFRLAVEGGFTGQITANSFMKREFGKKLIEEFLPKFDVTHVLDTSLAFIPGHGTPTLILLGRNRRPVAPSIRCVGGIQREDCEPADPARGLYWTALVGQIDDPGSESEFVSVTDIKRERLQAHPWSIGGGGAAELKEQLDVDASQSLGDVSESIGITCFTLADDVFVTPLAAARRTRIPSQNIRSWVTGDNVRDWNVMHCDTVLFPYREDFKPIPENPIQALFRHLWFFKIPLASAVLFGGQTKVAAGCEWYEYGRLTHQKLRTPLTIVFACVATHNHFVLDRGEALFNRHSPIVKLPPEATEDDHFALLGLLNSSTSAFWLRQTCHDKGGGGIGGGIAAEAWERFLEYTGTKLLDFPLPNNASYPAAKARQLDRLQSDLLFSSPHSTLIRSLGKGSLNIELRDANLASQETQDLIIAHQEELDWQCYRLYGLLNEDLTLAESPPIALGQRAFEIVMARKMAVGELGTTWFERHGSTPITDIPEHWPENYRRVVERRIELIETDRTIGLIERPEYKRRWNADAWDSQVERALRSWLLDRLESYFDFDGRMNDEGEPTSRLDVTLTSVARLADVARQDAEFLEVGEVYRDDAAFDVDRLVEELVGAEHAPLLPVLRYKPAGLRKRVEWEKTWALQRAEDALESQLSIVSRQLEEETDEGKRQGLSLLREQLTTDHGQLTKSIPVPPKYKSSDFISTGGARYWHLRGKLDVPKERWVSFPHCEGEDGTLMIAWAGYDHLQLARAVSGYYVDIQERLGGRDDPRLEPLLGCLIELLPWLKQWHNDVDPEFNVPMGDYFEGFIQDEARQMNKTVEEIKNWQPPKRTGKRTRRKKKAAE